jgi:hypothetical protein
VKRHGIRFQGSQATEWWNGDSVFNPPAYSVPVSDLEKKLREVNLSLQLSISSSGSQSPKLIREIELVKPYVMS